MNLDVAVEDTVFTVAIDRQLARAGDAADYNTGWFIGFPAPRQIDGHIVGQEFVVQCLNSLAQRTEVRFCRRLNGWFYPQPGRTGIGLCYGVRDNLICIKLFETDVAVGAHFHEHVFVVAGIEQLKQKVSGRHDQLNGLWAQKAPLKEEVQRLQQTAETCRTQITELAAKKKELTEQKTEQEKQLAAINDDTMRLEMELKQQSGAVDLNTACRDKLQEKADDLRREQEKLDKKVEELRAESNALQEHNTKALAEISFLERSIPTLRVALGEAASRKENLTAQKEELDARLEETEGKIHELSHAVELLEQTELPAKAKKKSDVELKLHELKDENNTLQNDIRNCEMSIDDHKQKKDELEQQLEGKSQKGLALNLEARIAEYQNRKIECERLEQKLEAQQSQLNAKNTEIAQKKEEQEVLQLRFSQAENELESYQHSIAELTQRKDELADLEQRLKILKDVHQALQKHAKRLSELSPIGNYSDAENLGDLMDTMKDIIENIHKTMEQYIRKTNQSLEGIK